MCHPQIRSRGKTPSQVFFWKSSLMCSGPCLASRDISKIWRSRAGLWCCAGMGWTWLDQETITETYWNYFGSAQQLDLKNSHVEPVSASVSPKSWIKVAAFMVKSCEIRRLSCPSSKDMPLSRLSVILNQHWSKWDESTQHHSTWTTWMENPTNVHLTEVYKSCNRLGLRPQVQSS